MTTTSSHQSMDAFDVCWNLSQAKDKAPPFSNQVNALGVSIDISSMGDGKLLIDNTIGRKSEILWVWDGFHEIDFAVPLTWYTWYHFDATFVFQRLRPSDCVLFSSNFGTYIWWFSQITFFFSTIVGTNLYHHLISSNQLDRFLWAVGCCNHGLKQRLLE